MFANQEAELFKRELQLVTLIDHLQQQKDLPIVSIQMRPLPECKNIRNGERMNLKKPPELLHHLHRTQAFNIYPGNFFVVEGIQELTHGAHLFLDKRVSVVLDEFNGRRMGFGRNRDSRRRRTGWRVVELVHGVDGRKQSVISKQ